MAKGSRLHKLFLFCWIRQRAGTDWVKVYLAGGFGYELDVEKAVRIGLIPRVLETRCVAVGNTSLAGGGALRQEGHKEPIQREKHLQHIADISTSLNLAEQPEFEARYFPVHDVCADVRIRNGEKAAEGTQAYEGGGRMFQRKKKYGTQTYDRRKLEARF